MFTATRSYVFGKSLCQTDLRRSYKIFRSCYVRILIFGVIVALSEPQLIGLKRSLKITIPVPTEPHKPEMVKTRTRSVTRIRDRNYLCSSFLPFFLPSPESEFRARSFFEKLPPFGLGRYLFVYVTIRTNSRQ